MISISTRTIQEFLLSVSIGTNLALAYLLWGGIVLKIAFAVIMSIVIGLLIMTMYLWYKFTRLYKTKKQK